MKNFNVIDLALNNLYLFCIICSLIVMSAYNKIKVFTHKSKKKDILETPQFDEMGNPIKERQSLNWKHEYIPFVLAILLLVTFYPTNIFTYLPFNTISPILDVVYSALIMSSVSNANYASVEKLGNLFSGMIGRVMKIF